MCGEREKKKIDANTHARTHLAWKDARARAHTHTHTHARTHTHAQVVQAFEKKTFGDGEAIITQGASRAVVNSVVNVCMRSLSCRVRRALQ